ncbi:hypothetical protein NQD34_018222 [Periophthalmus magnuspinnatus]|nr:hypothetical protein NQD34_018222 [Periophthalmus magnuspinnatus]
MKKKKEEEKKKKARERNPEIRTETRAARRLSRVRTSQSRVWHRSGHGHRDVFKAALRNFSRWRQVRVLQSIEATASPWKRAAGVHPPPQKSYVEQLFHLFAVSSASLETENAPFHLVMSSGSAPLFLDSARRHFRSRLDRFRPGVRRYLPSERGKRRLKTTTR